MRASDERRAPDEEGGPSATVRRLLAVLQPEGLATVLAVLAMAFVVGFAVDQAAWVGQVAGTRISQTGFLPVATVLAAAVGMALGRSRVGTLKAHIAGATVGALFLLNAAAASISSAASLDDRLRALNWSVNAYAWESFVIQIRSSETSVFLLLVGALLWGAAQLGGFSVFRRRRPMPMIALGAGALLLNMSLTTQDQFAHLVVFAAAAMLLLIRLNLLNEQEGWRTRQLVDIGQAGELFLSRGAAFIVLAVVASITLATAASSAPLQRVWRDADSRLLDIGYEINRWLGGVSGPIRGSTNLFGPTQTLRDVWVPSTGPVFTARVGDSGAYYWRGSTYDFWDGKTWHQRDPIRSVVAGGQNTLALSAERPAELHGRRQLAVSVTSINLGGDVIVVPESPLVVDRTTELTSHAGEGGFITLALTDGLREGTQYSAISLVANDSGAQQVTANQLAAADTRYDPWLSRYLVLAPDSVGQRTYDEADRIVAELPRAKRNPYHIAEAIQNWFWRDGGFDYEVDVTGLCLGENLVDCFLDVKKGVCERFATAMVMMLRTQGIAARYVVGYLPGTPLGENTWLVDGTASHAWVEVYFPGYGWYRFDPTPGNSENGQVPTDLPDGPDVPRPSGTFLPPLPPNRLPDETFEPAPSIGPFLPGQDQGGGIGPSEGLSIALLLLAAGVGLILLASRLRGGGPVEAGRAYAGLTRLATRLGHGPRPTQTVYEYTGGLAQLVPAVAPDLRMLATAKVEATYSRRPETWAFGHRLGIAYRRARLGLLRLALRKPGWVRQPIKVRRRRS